MFFFSKQLFKALSSFTEMNEKCDCSHIASVLHKEKLRSKVISFLPGLSAQVTEVNSIHDPKGNKLL